MYLLQAPAEEWFDCREIPYTLFNPGFTFNLFVCETCKDGDFIKVCAGQGWQTDMPGLCWQRTVLVLGNSEYRVD